MQERVPIARARVLPVALVQHVLDIETKRHFSPFSARSIACAEVQQVVAQHADRVIARRRLGLRVAPSGKKMESTHEGNIHVREPGSPEMRYVNDLLVIEGSSASP